MRSVIVTVPAVLLLTSCPRKNESPTEVVRAFLAAQSSADGQELLSHVQEADREFLAKVGGTDKAGRFLSLAQGDSWTIGPERREGERVMVSVALDSNGVHTERILALVRENGRWRIDLVPDDVRQRIESLITPRPAPGGAASGRHPGSTEG